MFALLESFAERRSDFAPYLYKSLVFALIENRQRADGGGASDSMCDAIVANMQRVLERFSSVPIGVLVEPLLKQASLHGYSNLDFDFFITLARHERLQLRPFAVAPDVEEKRRK